MDINGLTIIGPAIQQEPKDYNLIETLLKKGANPFVVARIGISMIDCINKLKGKRNTKLKNLIKKHFPENNIDNYLIDTNKVPRKLQKTQ